MELAEAIGVSGQAISSAVPVAGSSRNDYHTILKILQEFNSGSMEGNRLSGNHPDEEELSTVKKLYQSLSVYPVGLKTLLPVL